MDFDTILISNPPKDTFAGYHVSFYDDMRLYAKSFHVGDTVYKVDEDGTEEGTICFVFPRSIQRDMYDRMTEMDFLSLYRGDYDFSGEFILDDDCFYVFCKRKERR